MSEEDKKLEAAAEQWVNIIFAQIEADKLKKTQASKESDYSLEGN